MLSELAGPGAPFDAESSVCSLIPVVIHAMMIMALNKTYRGIAEWLVSVVITAVILFTP
jgi:hypothetical protein